MPSTFAHYSFGKEVYKKLPGSIKASVDISPELFAIGQHGPDILFYYDAIHPNAINKIGYGMHDLPASDFFKPAIEVLKNTSKDEGQRSYIYGFVCHFILDSCCHWYVEEAIEHTGVTHTGIEGEFDRMLMVKEGLDPIRYQMAQHIVPSEINGRIISEFFPEITSEQAYKALEDMIKFNKLLVCPGFPKRAVIKAALKVTGLYDDIGGMIINKKPDPRCQESNERLQRLFNAAIDEAVRYLLEFERAVLTDEPLSDRFNRTFGSDKESKEEYEAY